MKVKIHREGLNIIFGMLIVLLVLNVPCYLFIRPRWISLAFLVFSVVLFLLIVNFFRSPRRHYTGDTDRMVLSSVDGKVVALERTYESEYLKSEAIQLSVFMTPLNVHANWFPVQGKVLYTKHHCGRFMSAYLPKSSTDNERSTIAIQTDDGNVIVARQVAGAIARRIVTYAEEGDRAEFDDHMGFIKFGSRVDLFLPVDSEIFVKLDDKTVGGITPVARLPRKS